MKEFANSMKGSLLNFKTWSRLIIDINEIMTVLKYKDIRSVIKWCNEHDVFVLNQGNTQVVNQIEFILAYYKPFMLHLKQTKKNWKELFVNYVCGNVRNVIETDGQKKEVEIESPSYVKRSVVEATFLKKMKGL